MEKVLVVKTKRMKSIERTIQTKFQGFIKKMYVNVLYKGEKTQDKLWFLNYKISNKFF
jgi:hypothetical protein